MEAIEAMEAMESSANEGISCGDLYRNCPFFPDMSVKDDEWTWDETGSYKIRKKPKRFRCLYDDCVLEWDRNCPRKVNENYKKELQDVEEVQDVFFSSDKVLL